MADRLDDGVIEGADVKDSQFGIRILQTQPADVTVHLIEDKDLEKIIGLASPVELGLSTTAGGAFLGLLPSIASAAKMLFGEKPLDASEIILSTVAFICLTVSVILGISASKGMESANKTISEIRKRPLSEGRSI